MGWEDRLKEAAYTSKSGKRLTFKFEDVSKTWNKKTTAFEFPNVTGGYIQDRGVGIQKFPMLCHFTGADCDIEADGFEVLLNEDGYGRLEHPLYAAADVIPFGEIGRRDDLKTAANQTIVEVEFWETIGVIYPTGGVDLSSSVSAAVDAFNAASAAQFAKQIDISGAANQITFKDRIESLLGTVESALGKIAKTTQKVNDQFQGVVDSINRGIDVLIAAPLTLAFQTKIAIQAPGRAASSIRDRLEAYGNLAQTIFSSSDSVSSDANLFLTRELFASTYVSGSVVSVLNNQFTTRTDALEAAQSLLAQWDLLTAWRDDNWEAIVDADTDAIPQNSSLDTGEGYSALLDAVGLAAGFLVEISFSLKQERALVLTSARSFLDLGYELYGEDFESKIDFFINSNRFTGSEILEIPKGRRVKYYV